MDKFISCFMAPLDLRREELVLSSVSVVRSDSRDYRACSSSAYIPSSHCCCRLVLILTIPMKIKLPLDLTKGVADSPDSVTLRFLMI